MFRPTWPSSGVYDIFIFIPEGICFAVFVAFVACCYIMQIMEINGNSKKKTQIRNCIV
jgi:hypothetical protein